ncbi:MAG: methyltransferase domain-containing protein [Candidatus Rokuibacteriota bacterium]
MATKFDARVVERLERMYASPEIAEQRARTRAALAARPGERGLDIGCGPAFLACELARDVGAEGRIVGIDSSEDMLAAARARVAREDLTDRIELRAGEATRLEFDAASFDFIAAVQVYLYVADLDRALGETVRVLRPGGRLVVVDTDWDSCVWLTSDRDRHHRVITAGMADYVNPHLPPQLPGLLRRAGLHFAHGVVIPILTVRWEPGSFSVGMIDATKERAIRRGVPREEAEAWEADLRRRTGDGDYFFSLNRFLFVATKPAS